MSDLIINAKPRALKLNEIATRINSHLKRFEADPAINIRRGDPVRGLGRYFNAHAWASGRYISITHISYQGSFCVSKSRALAYLAWLDAGNVGTLWESERSL